MECQSPIPRGEHLLIERGTERMEIEKPEEPFAKEMFVKIVAGSTVSDIEGGTVNTLEETP